MKKTELILWLRSQQETIEEIILNSANEFVNVHESELNFGYDLSCSQKEGYNLLNGIDLCYDRYTTALSYSLWYQARRINVFLSHFLDKIIDACSSSQPVNIFDLGAGTGCVQFCFGLIATGFTRHGFEMPILRIVNVDSSPFMLSYLKDYIWKHATNEYPEFKNILTEYHTCSWSNSGDIAIVNPWISASYLFDSSDNKDYLAQHFDQLINDFDPEKILLLTSNQTAKKQMIADLTTKMTSREYVVTASSTDNVFSGNLLKLTAFRNTLVAKYKLQASTRNVSWIDGSFTAIGLAKKQAGLSLVLKEVPQDYDLFNSPLKIRRSVKLNELQFKAAEFETRPSIITGPAGCGKSVVMTEKIINTIDHFKWAVPLNILITTFNKSLLKQLRAWITDLLETKEKKFRQVYFLEKNGSNDGTGEIIISDTAEIKIKFVHFEMLGKYIGKMKYNFYNEAAHLEKIASFVLDVRQEMLLKDIDHTDILTPKFILEEYHRVIYGLMCPIASGLENYKALERKGRTKRLGANQREVVWNALKKYVTWMFKDTHAGFSYIGKRRIFLKNLENETNTIEKFDHVYVDEFQDCTPADFQIMTKLLKDQNNLTISGDLAQAVHIGQSGIIPRDGTMARRNYHRLMGSYRLPYRISEAIQPLSHQISGYSADKDITVEMSPSKGAPPGARPIILYGETTEIIAAKLMKIKNFYSVYDLKTITILEYDGDLCRALREQYPYVETSTVLKLKGIEKEMIVWSLQAPIELENEILEFAYTIMTRTSCLLVIAISPEMKQYNYDVLKHLRIDRLIIWDLETEPFLQ
jgi:DNA helicase II / ATP-dependent DNA helicase PcrA